MASRWYFNHFFPLKNTEQQSSNTRKLQTQTDKQEQTSMPKTNNRVREVPERESNHQMDPDVLPKWPWTRTRSSPSESQKGSRISPDLLLTLEISPCLAFFHWVSKSLDQPMAKWLNGEIPKWPKPLTTNKKRKCASTRNLPPHKESGFGGLH